jgi:mono/diheme cytochrome c family protein
MTYPLRTDLLVIERPTAQPIRTDPPGQLDQSIARIGTSELNGKVYDPKKLSAADRQEIQAELLKAFGTPAAPRVVGDDDEIKDAVDKLNLQADQLAKGSVLYRRHCLTCHGVDGGGRGPTGPWVNPHPRDYRQGKFKFLSTVTFTGRKPRREDLYRTLMRGIDSTSMPAFNLLSTEDLNHLVSYVIHLSLRGEVEFDTMQVILANNGSKDGLKEGTIPDHIQSRLGLFMKNWAKSNKPIEPQPYPYTENQLAESIQRGYALFTNTEGAASCIGCHLDFGRQVPFRYDDWGTLVRPANLTSGVYRGGRRPIDFYWRIKGGIDPSAMPAADLKRDDAKKTDEYWDLVNFVQALPYPAMLPDDLREKIYGSGKPASHQHAEAR